jgi:hypothetical protein
MSWSQIGRIAQENRSDVQTLVKELLPIADTHMAVSGRSNPVPASVQEATSTASTPEAEGKATIGARFSEDKSPAAVRGRKEGGDERETGSIQSNQNVETSRNSINDEVERERRGFISKRRREELELDECSPSVPVDLKTGGSDRVTRLVDSLCEYSLAISAAVPSKEMALAEFQWRNGWFLSKVNALNDILLSQILRCLDERSLTPVHGTETIMKMDIQTDIAVIAEVYEVELANGGQQEEKGKF